MSTRFLDAAKQGVVEANWPSMPTTPDALIASEWTTLVARSRHVCINSDHGKKYVQLMRDNVAGPRGFLMSGKVKDPNGDSDNLASDAIEDAYRIFSERGNFDTTGTMSRADFERLAVSGWASDGEAIAVFRYGAAAGPYGFAVQMMDPMMLNPNHFERLANGNEIKHGIEFNAYGRAVNYWFRQQVETQFGYVAMPSQLYEVIPAHNVTHAFMVEMPGQKRGLAQTRAALWRMRMLKGFEDAALTNARVGAAKMGFTRDPNGAPDDDEANLIEAEPGTFSDIGNKELVAWDPAYPSGEFAPFVTATLRSIASGLSVSYNNLASDLTGVNFSSIRQGALDEREVYKGVQEWLIGSMAIPIYRKWLEWALLKEKITVAGKPLKFERMEKYRSVVFAGRRWSWIDPGADVAAAEKMLAMKLRSRTAIIAEMGNDAEDTWDEIAREDKDMAEMGVIPEPTAGSPMTQTPQQVAANTAKSPA